MLRSLSRVQARTLALLIALACLWIALRPPAETSVPGPRITYTDLMLYHDIAAHVSEGKSYYQAATELHREHSFPTRPFVTVREPTLAWIGANLGWKPAQIGLMAIIMLAVLAWDKQLETGPPGERIGVAIALLAGGASATQLGLIPLHELWAGALITLAMALRGGRWWWLGVVAGAAAVAIRELAVPFVLLSLVLSAWERRREETLAWLAVLVTLSIAMWFHAGAVAAHALPTDYPSEGWSGMRGPVAALRDLVDTSMLNRFDDRIALPLALLALLGWSAAPLRQRGFVLLFLLGMAAMIGLFARTQNFYWVLMTLPAWFIGLAFLPRALHDLMQAPLASKKAATAG